MSPTKYFLFISLFSVLLSIVYSAAVRVPELNVGDDFDKQSELVFAHVFYRHGDRNPILQCPGDKYDITYWPEGWGQLTNLGKQQHYKLGQWLGRRYSNFLSNGFNVSDIYVQSSDVDRTLMSAQANLAGLFPPQDGTQIWNRNLLWQPIPIHSMPVTMDHLIAPGVPESCTAYQKAYNEHVNSVEMKEFDESLQPFYDYITENAGITVNNYMILMLLRDSWLCESTHNLSLPEWTKALYPNNQKFDQVALKYYSLSSETKFLAKFASGFLLKDILDRFTSKIEKKLYPDRKLWIYSTHDSKLFSFLNSLDIFDNQFVPYSASIILELRRYFNSHYVQIFYKNSEETPKAIRIPGCGILCPLSSMYEIYDDILPKNDFVTECQIDEK